MDIWLGDPEAYFLGRRAMDAASRVLGVRRMEHADLPCLERLIRPETFEIFGDVNVGRIYEECCLSVVQCNEKHEVVSGMCLCNYPNVPAVPPEDWMHWIHFSYKVTDVTEMNTMFLHLLAWDKRYTGHFYEDLLTGLFDLTSYLQHVILVLPPQIILADVFEGQMIRVPPRCTTDRLSVQSIYVTKRHLEHPRLRTRRVVEEDNDDVVPIIDNESTLVKEFYGEFYVSEMVRYPDDCRSVIVSEDEDGLATGVMFLNKNIDVNTLNENFELTPYNGLRKPHGKDYFPPGYMVPASETYFRFFFRKEPPKEAPERFTPSPEESKEDVHNVTESSSGSTSNEVVPEEPKPVAPTRKFPIAKARFDISVTTFFSKPTASSYRPTLTPAFIESIFDVAQRKTKIESIDVPEVLPKDKVKVPSQPVYYGKVNAFVVEIFSTRDQVKRRWSRNFVEAAFECFPELDYCAILVPFYHPYIHLLEHFVRVPLRCDKDYPMALYITHRAALLGQTKVREASLSDREDVQELLQKIPKMEQILADFDESMREERNDLHCFVVQWEEVIVGVAIICPENEVTYIKRRYHVEDYIALQNLRHDAYGRILHFVLMPVFSIHLAHFFNEIIRFTGMMVLYYRLTDNALSALTRTHPVTICLRGMVPIHPRQRILYKYRGFEETDEPEEETEPFSLFMTTPKLSMMPVTYVDTKVVVVGASDCGLSCVEQLVFGQSSVRFTNLTLISPNGLPFDTDCDEASARLIPFEGRYCRNYHRTVPIRSWVNIVYGSVVTIQRKEKYVAVVGQGNIAYDYLILTCGLQYQRPRFEEEISELKKGVFVDRVTPWNCITVNNDVEAATCIQKLRDLTKNFQLEKKIVFYGHNVNLYCALEGLLEIGLDGSWVTVVQPPLEVCMFHDSAFYNDCEVYTEVMNSIKRSGAEIIVGWELIEWYLDNTPKGKMIEAVDIQMKGKVKTIGCDALINFNDRIINRKIFLAICKSGLVFDGLLVVDPDLRTNDQWIFAAGTMTKYCKKFHADNWQQSYFNRLEIGERLAKILRSVIEKQHRGDETPFVPFKGKSYLDIPVFRSPIIIGCTLPGGYHYLHVCKPGKPVLRKYAIHYHVYGEVMITGSATSDIGYCRIRLNRFDTVETITCLSKKDFEVRHMIALHGKHESLLNELKARFNDSLIIDFYAYFREPWAMALFYDKFECLRVENRATLLSRTAIPGQSLISDCIRALDRSHLGQIEESSRRNIQSRYAGSVYQQEIEENLLDFLQFCEDDVPVYCTPDKLRELYADIAESPLYSDV